MYILEDDSHTYYGPGGQQKHTQGAFLLLMTPEDADPTKSENLRACVRQVALEQMGHFMMGTARIGGESFTVSGTYGNMGLTMDVPREIWEQYGEPVPEPLFEKWAKGGGHNSAGAEGPDLREWAVENLDRLTP